jgi:signal transduction histidine kinase
LFVQSHLLAGVNFAIVCWLGAGALLAVVARATGRRSINYLLFAGLSVALAVSTAGQGSAYLFAQAPDARAWRMSLTVAQAAGIIAAAVHVHFALRYAGARRRSTFAAGIWGLAILLEALLLRGGWAAFDNVQVTHFQVLGLDVAQAWAAPAVPSFAFLVAVPLMHLAASGLFGAAYLGGRREALTLFLGAGVLALLATNDGLVLAGRLQGLLVLPLGSAFLIVMMSVGFLLRHAQLRAEFDKQGTQLTERIKQVRRARRTLREMQSELGKREQLAVIGEMAAVIAHEVRNPLAVIANAVASLRREGLSRHDHDVLLSILDEEANRLNRLVSDLLAYARPVNLQRQRVVLGDLAERAAVLAAHRTEAKVVFDESSVRGQIWGDSNLLRQVLDNLVENAVQATGGTGNVQISVTAKTKDGVDGFLVSVTDDGEGMDTQVRSRAKDPFFTTRPSGTGLGLAIVNRIVEAHGGELVLQSRAGEGSTVSIFLPVGSESIPPSDPRRTLDTDPPMSSDDLLSSSSERPAAKRTGSS